VNEKKSTPSNPAFGVYLKKPFGWISTEPFAGLDEPAAKVRLSPSLSNPPSVPLTAPSVSELIAAGTPVGSTFPTRILTVAVLLACPIESMAK
jgi:hypothetical protein